MELKKAIKVKVWIKQNAHILFWIIIYIYVQKGQYSVCLIYAQVQNIACIFHNVSIFDFLIFWAICL